MVRFFQIQIVPLKFIIDTLKALSRAIGYLGDPQHRITQLMDAMDQLRAQKEDLGNIIMHAEHGGEVPNQHVQRWFHKVDDFIEQISKIVDDNRSFRWYINRRAAHSLADIKEFRQKFVVEFLTTKLPPIQLQEVPAELPDQVQEVPAELPDQNLLLMATSVRNTHLLIFYFFLTLTTLCLLLYLHPPSQLQIMLLFFCGASLHFLIEIVPLKFIIDTLKAMSRAIGYLGDPQHRITQLMDAMDQLRAQKEDLRNITRHAEHDGEVQNQHVLHWFHKVDDFIEQISKIVDDNRSFRWYINRRAAHGLADIKEFRQNFVVEFLTTKRLRDQNFVLEIYLSQLKTFVKDDESQIIGIWGMGGVGKTTLLNSLNNNLGQSQQIFDYVIWAVVSRDYNLGRLQRYIARRLCLPLCKDGAMQARMILDFLENKSFLLLLDDLWNPINFTELGIPHPSRTRATKQKMVFTTRFEDVCGKMQALPKIKIECLNEAGAWRLFQNKVGKQTLQAHPKIPQLARQVAKECDGLPLALVLIGSTMSTKKMPREWQNALTLLQMYRPYEIHDMDGMIFSKLKFSYDNLADEIFRKCFLLCSLWPEHHSISKTDLIECWMGHDLVDERKFDTINEAYDSGYSIIGALQAASLLEPNYYDKDRTVKMHDVVRDLALSIASDYGKKPNRFIVFSSDSFFLRTKCSELETFIVHGHNSFKSGLPRYFERTHALTYLDLSHTPIIQNGLEEIGLLVNLRYLNLSYTKIRTLPLELANLHELRFLLLRGLLSIKVPWAVVNELEKLSVIDMTDTRCENWLEILGWRGNLKGLGILLQNIEELHKLDLLPNVVIWRLTLVDLQYFNLPLQLGSHNSSSIQTLTIKNSKRLLVMSMESDWGGDIQKWCLSRLEELRLMYLQNLQIICWPRVHLVEMLPSLTVLKIHKCNKLTHISWVIGLPSLEDLSVRNCRDVKQIIDDDYSELSRSDDKENGVGTAGLAFPSLKKIELQRLVSLKVFGGLCAFPSLEWLLVIHCPLMKTLPFGDEMAGKKLKQIIGWRKWWENLNMEDDVRATLLPYFQEPNFPNRFYQRLLPYFQEPNFPDSFWEEVPSNLEEFLSNLEDPNFPDSFYTDSLYEELPYCMSPIS